MNYFVKPVVCDYGIYRLDDNGERKLIDICNSLSNAEMVAEILNSDDKHKVWSRPTGEWISTFEMEEFYEEMFICSNCKNKSFAENFCPNCGAKMKVKGEEE